MTADRISGQNDRKLSSKAQAYADRLAKHGFEGMDTPGRRGRPLSPATLVAKRDGKSARTRRRQIAVVRDLVMTLNISPVDLGGTSLAAVGEQQALLKLPSRQAAILAMAAIRGRKVSAKLRVARLRAKERASADPVGIETSALIRLWVKSSPAARTRFLDMLAEVNVGREDEG